MPKVLIPLAAGAEEMEATIVVDVLRRAGVEVVVAGVSGAEPVECSRGLKIVPDRALDEVQGDFDAIVLPGGAPGARALADSAEVGRRLREQRAAGRFIGAICAAPTALLRHSIDLGARITSHPSVRDRLMDAYEHVPDRVVVSDKLVTSQGPGTSFEFALTLVERLCGSDVAEQIRGPLILPR